MTDPWANLPKTVAQQTLEAVQLQTLVLLRIEERLKWATRNDKMPSERKSK